MLIGTKGLGDFHPFCKMEREELYRGAEQILSEGVPLTTPAALPVNDLVRIAATLKQYSGLLSRFISDYDETSQNEDDVQAVVEVVSQFFEDAQELLNIEPPPVHRPDSVITL
tara:strand:- start:133 stop:471 length:339 start_codon:yes stop_codon:yes gene_type:complete